jgi:hypothetical protein
MSTPSPTDAAEALAAVHAARRQVLQGDRARWPWRRHAVFAAVVSGCLAANAAPPAPALAIDLALAIVVGVTIAVDRARTGVFVNGWRAGPTRPVVMGICLLYLGLQAVCLWLKFDRGLWQAPLAGGAVLFPAALFGSKLRERIYRRDLERGA